MEEDAEILQDPEIMDDHRETVFAGYESQTEPQYSKTGSYEVSPRWGVIGNWSLPLEDIKLQKQKILQEKFISSQKQHQKFDDF